MYTYDGTVSALEFLCNVLRAVFGVLKIHSTRPKKKHYLSTLSRWKNEENDQIFQSNLWIRYDLIGNNNGWLTLRTMLLFQMVQWSMSFCQNGFDLTFRCMRIYPIGFIPSFSHQHQSQYPMIKKHRNIFFIQISFICWIQIICSNCQFSQWSFFYVAKEKNRSPWSLECSFLLQFIEISIQNWRLFKVKKSILKKKREKKTFQWLSST